MVEAGGRDNHIWIKVPASFNKTKLGIDAMAVVDPQSMKVIGLAGLRVAVASCMPRMVSGTPMRRPT